ncbi:MAG: type I-E CRISPR-associated protein Cas7/Cse4/CasC [Pelolinea sp.]|nr:type I-E CRISPR-associated protein Cas7/Cse4/CasC [Pelolinea sp.]
MFIEYHMIQNFAPSNLNRDDTNNPKDCEFGGARRARISSQCIKRAIRLEPVFTKITQVPTGERTRWLAAEIKKKLIGKGKAAEEAQERSSAFVGALLGGMDKGKEGRSKVLFYISEEEKNHIAAALLANWENLDDKQYEELAKQYKKAFENRSSAPDIALFGRMLADDPKLSLDAACQVAHAISTHRVSMEVDFFTAVDDLLDEEDSGAGMMGVTGFNSACFYRYACIDWEQLKDNLGGDSALAAKTVEGFLRSSIQAVPTGKQNSFAAQNAPSFVMAVVRADGTCWSLANAFEKPVKADSHHSLTENSITALDKYWGNLKRVYGGDQLVAVLALEQGFPLEILGGSEADNVENWVAEVLNALPKE